MVSIDTKVWVGTKTDLLDGSAGVRSTTITAGSGSLNSTNEVESARPLEHGQAADAAGRVRNVCRRTLGSR
jgi:hypothetical protein